MPTGSALGRSGAQQIPITYVPFRNAHFLSVAVSWAEVIGAETIYIGAVEQDSSGYPDCRPEYYEAFNRVIRAGTKEGKIRIVTPLIAMRKAEIVRLGAQLGAPFELTWSCYSGHQRACGVCESCVLRLRAFEAVGIPDPIPYQARAAGNRRATSYRINHRCLKGLPLRHSEHESIHSPACGAPTPLPVCRACSRSTEARAVVEKLCPPAPAHRGRKGFAAAGRWPASWPNAILPIATCRRLRVPRATASPCARRIWLNFRRG